MGLPARLTDPWFEAQFFCEGKEGGGYRIAHPSVVPGLSDKVPITFAQSQGVFLWCPCGYGKAEFPSEGGRPHGLIVPFGNPPCGIALPENFGPTSRDGKTHPRWTVSGSGLGDLTTQPSIDVGDPSCWHGYITSGEVR